MIRQGQVGLKAWIPRQYPKPQRQIQSVARRVSDKLDVFQSSEVVTFMTLAKTSGATKLLPKYCKTFNELEYCF